MKKVHWGKVYNPNNVGKLSVSSIWYSLFNTLFSYNVSFKLYMFKSTELLMGICPLSVAYVPARLRRNG